MNFGIGPAGTGKTYLAVAAGVHALLNDKVQKIILIRPAVEAGEKLGFLPGDLSPKGRSLFKAFIRCFIRNAWIRKSSKTYRKRNY